jgi:hypothetical protein
MNRVRIVSISRVTRRSTTAPDARMTVSPEPATSAVASNLVLNVRRVVISPARS